MHNRLDKHFTEGLLQRDRDKRASESTASLLGTFFLLFLLLFFIKRHGSRGIGDASAVSVPADDFLKDVVLPFLYISSILLFFLG